MKNRLLLSSTFLVSAVVVTIVTISLYQFDILHLNKKIDFKAPAAETSIDANDDEESSSASKAISFFSFILNFSKSPN